MAWLLSSSSTKRFSGTTESLCLMLLALALNLFFLECWWWAIGASTPCLARVFRMIWFSIFRKNLFATPCLYPLYQVYFAAPLSPLFLTLPAAPVLPCCTGNNTACSLSANRASLPPPIPKVYIPHACTCTQFTCTCTLRTLLCAVHVKWSSTRRCVSSGPYLCHCLFRYPIQYKVLPPPMSHLFPSWSALLLLMVFF
jgi:hypothetical protein